MSTAERSQDPKAWQRARDLNRRVYATTAWGEFPRDVALRDQIRRASISVSSAVAEGFERRSPRDVARFLPIATASAAERLSQLCLALDLNHAESSDVDALAAHLGEAPRPSGGLLHDLRPPDGSAAREPDMPVYPELGTQNSDLLDL